MHHQNPVGGKLAIGTNSLGGQRQQGKSRGTEQKGKGEFGGNGWRDAPFFQPAVDNDHRPAHQETPQRVERSAGFRHHRDKAKHPVIHQVDGIQVHGGVHLSVVKIETDQDKQHDQHRHHLILVRFGRFGRQIDEVKNGGGTERIKQVFTGAQITENPEYQSQHDHGAEHKDAPDFSADRLLVVLVTDTDQLFAENPEHNQVDAHQHKRDVKITLVREDGDKKWKQVARGEGAKIIQRVIDCQCLLKIFTSVVAERVAKQYRWTRGG